MRFDRLLDKLDRAKVMVCCTDFEVNSAYENDPEFRAFTQEKIRLRNEAKKLYDNRNETIRFYLRNIVGIVLKRERFGYRYLMINRDRYDYQTELSAMLIERVTEIYRKYKPLHDRLVKHVLECSNFKNDFSDVFKRNLRRAFLDDFFILGNAGNTLTLIIDLNSEVKNHLVAEVKDEQTLGRVYIDYALFTDEERNRDTFIYGCTPHEDCLFEDEEPE